MDVAVFVVDGVADFGLTAVLEVLRTANGLASDLPDPPRPFGIRTVSAGGAVRSAHGYTIPAEPVKTVLAEGPDLLLVPAVEIPQPEALVREVSGASGRTVVHALNAAREAGVRVAAACTATFYLAEAGVLDGVRATTSWWLGPTLRRRYPRVEVDETRTLCVGEDVITAGGALAHLDLALSLVAASSPALADLVSRYLLIGNRTTQQDFAATEILARGNPLAAAFERRVRSRLGESLHVAALAGELGVTERSLQRTLQAELGMSPRELITEIRLQRAIHLLRTTGLTVDAVAAASVTSTAARCGR